MSVIYDSGRSLRIPHCALYLVVRLLQCMVQCRHFNSTVGGITCRRARIHTTGRSCSELSMYFLLNKCSKLSYQLSCQLYITREACVTATTGLYCTVTLLRHADIFVCFCCKYSGADNSLTRSDWKKIEISPFVVRRGDQCCREELVGRTNFWFFF
jgi:hypothetical protein